MPVSPIDEELAWRFIEGEVLQAEDAEQVMAELQQYGGWRLYVTVALADLRNGFAEHAEHVLTELMKNYQALDLG